MKHAAVTLLLGLAALAASAQPVYRCANVYTQTPCPEGRIVDATDPRTAAQRAEAQRVAAQEKQLAVDMQRERLTEQLAARPAAASSLSGAAPAAVGVVERPRAKKKRIVVKPARGADFIAVGTTRKK